MAKLKLGIFLNVMPHHSAPAERGFVPTSAPWLQMALKQLEGEREAARAAGASIRETKSTR